MPGSMPFSQEYAGMYAILPRIRGFFSPFPKFSPAIPPACTSLDTRPATCWGGKYSFVCNFEKCITGLYQLNPCTSLPSTAIWLSDSCFTRLVHANLTQLLAIVR